MLGGNIIGKTDTISLAIYNTVFDGDYDLAMVLCSVLVVLSVAIFIGLQYFQKKEKFI